jgi:hypothetical protein
MLPEFAEAGELARRSPGADVRAQKTAAGAAPDGSPLVADPTAAPEGQDLRPYRLAGPLGVAARGALAVAPERRDVAVPTPARGPRRAPWPPLR